ncbi:hypothetical protein HOY80DRAFT_1078540 [Tuber brumale]|nr:hypothetical protein HOY80DRAFT_1078540 [Tuber brumale]
MAGIIHNPEDPGELCEGDVGGSGCSRDDKQGDAGLEHIHQCGGAKGVFVGTEAWGDVLGMTCVYVPAFGWMEVRGAQKLGSYFFGIWLALAIVAATLGPNHSDMVGGQGELVESRHDRVAQVIALPFGRIFRYQHQMWYGLAIGSARWRDYQFELEDTDCGELKLHTELGFHH